MLPNVQDILVATDLSENSNNTLRFRSKRGAEDGCKAAYSTRDRTVVFGRVDHVADVHAGRGITEKRRSRTGTPR